jgi:hypothetical protein
MTGITLQLHVYKQSSKIHGNISVIELIVSISYKFLQVLFLHT